MENNKTNIIIGYLEELKLNMNSSMISFLIQRITGIFLVIYMFLHLWTLSAIRNGGDAFTHSMAKFDNLIGHFMEWALFICVLAHMINGFRLLWGDFFYIDTFQKKLTLGGVVVLVIVSMFSLCVFF